MNTTTRSDTPGTAFPPLKNSKSWASTTYHSMVTHIEIWAVESFPLPPPVIPKLFERADLCHGAGEATRTARCMHRPLPNGSSRVMLGSTGVISRSIVILQNGLRNFYHFTDQMVITGYYYQGLFLKKPPLTPQKLPNCTTLLRSLV